MDDREPSADTLIGAHRLAKRREGGGERRDSWSSFEWPDELRAEWREYAGKRKRREITERVVWALALAAATAITKWLGLSDGG